MSGLCEGTTYQFSAWVLNLVKVGGFCSSPIPTNVKFEIWDSTNSNLLASGDTGNIGAGTSANWETYGLVFQTLVGQNEVILKMINNGQGGCGNDLAIDDIEFKSCGDIVTLTDTNNVGSVSLCSSQAPFTSTITATPDFTVYSSHFYQWQKSTDAGMLWTDIVGETNQTLSISVNSTTSFRAKIAEVEVNLVNAKCVSFSNEFQVNVTPLPPKPSVKCWQTATINETTCSWDITGTQPVQPLIECWQTATFNTSSCVWDITGSQPIKPITACYENAVFNTATCAWDIISTVPTLPVLKCYESAVFNLSTCSWDISGTQPLQPTIACYEIATFNAASCSWDVTGAKPGAIIEEDLVFCNGKTLDVIAQTSLSNTSYLWSTGEITNEIIINMPGVYSVDISGDGCSFETRVFNVLEVEYPIIETIVSDENDIIITSTNIEDVLYSIDGSTFQSNNIFYNVEGGLYTIYVKEENCDYTVSLEYLHFYIPKYFTPNNDGFHDTFDLAGIENYSTSQVAIYNRYGKLLKFSKNSPFKWDGTFNNQNLPTNDYWYVVIIEGKRRTGHFTLKR